MTYNDSHPSVLGVHVFVLIATALFLASSAPAADPVISNLSVGQAEGSLDVVIMYDLAADDASTVTLESSVDDGQTWQSVDVADADGDWGPGVNVGADKEIIWHAAAPPAGVNNEVRIRLTANDHILTVLLPSGVTLRMLEIPAGSFTIGSPDGEAGHDDNEGPAHVVTISQPFLIGETEVTQDQWLSYADPFFDPLQSGQFSFYNTSFFWGDGRRPVERVGWNDIMGVFGYVAWLNNLPAPQLQDSFVGVFNLPTEAQWEYACRAGSSGPYSGDLGTNAWFKPNSQGRPHAVSLKSANAWGLYDMHGNVFEWVRDDLGQYVAGAVVDPIGVPTGMAVIRGGSWNQPKAGLRSAYRRAFNPNQRTGDIGYRVSADGTLAATAIESDAFTLDGTYTVSVISVHDSINDLGDPKIDAATYVLGETADWSVTSPVAAAAAGKRYVASPAAGNVVIGGNLIDIPVSVVWTTQYEILSATDGPGTVDQAGGWLDAGSRLTLTASADAGGRFAYWSIAGTTAIKSTSNPLVLAANAARTATAHFIAVGVDSDNDGLPDGWEQKYFGTIAGIDAADDPDGDGLTNAQEYDKGTDPTWPTACFRAGWNLFATPWEADATFTLETQIGAELTKTIWRWDSDSDQYRLVDGTDPAYPVLRTKVGYWIWSDSLQYRDIPGIAAVNKMLSFPPGWLLMGGVKAGTLAGGDGVVGDLWHYHKNAFQNSKRVIKLYAGYWVLSTGAIELELP